MITVNKFQLSPDRKQIDVEVSSAVGTVINDVKLWDETTYLDQNAGIDLISKITGPGPDYSFSILAADASLTSFDGIHFASFGSNELVVSGPITVVVAAFSFTRFFYCIQDMLCNLESDCNGCKNSIQNVLLIDLLLESLKSALIIGRFNDAVKMLKSLNKICTTSCDTCGDDRLAIYAFGVLDNKFVLA